jgi:phosphotransferase system IIB component
MIINHGQDLINYANKMELRLTCQVNARNQVNQMANEWLPKIKTVLEKWLGQKVSLITGGKPVKLKAELEALGMPNELAKQIIVSFDTYSAKVQFRICVSIGSESKSTEQTCYLGDMANGLILNDLHYQHKTFETNYNKEDVIKARNALNKALKDADEAVSKARYALYPFSEHDNF